MKFWYFLNTPGRQQSKMLIQSKNIDKKSLETVFSIAICCLTGWRQMATKNTVFNNFDPHLSTFLERFRLLPIRCVEYASSQGTDEPGHRHSLTRPLAAHKHKVDI